MKTQPEEFEILHRGSGVFEAPRWDGGDFLFFTNVTVGGVHRLDLRDGEVRCVVPHRRGLGGMALSADGGFVVSGRNLALKRADRDETIVLFSPEVADPAIIGLNDLAVDPCGSVVVGALGPGALSPSTLTGRETPPGEGEGTGAVYRVDAHGSRRLTGDIGHTNGIGFSPDGRHAYLSDSLRRIVYRFRSDIDGWAERERFCHLPQGLPDGLAVATDGSVWVACALASEVVVINTNGSVRTTYRMPSSLTTSVSFGGADGRTVYVTSGSHDGSEPALIARFRSPIPGRPMPHARVSKGNASDFTQRP